jgi:hypothetical protein
MRPVRLAGQSRRAAGDRRVGEVEHLVVDGDDLAAAGAQVAPPAHALGRRGGGGVERLGGRGPPVHQQRLVVALLVEQAEAADVAPLARVGVEAAERQAVLGGPQRGEAVGVHRGGGVALGERLRRAHGLVVQHRLQASRGVGPALVEPAVEHGDVAPLVVQAVVAGAVRVGHDGGAGGVPEGGRAVGTGHGRGAVHRRGWLGHRVVHLRARGGPALSGGPTNLPAREFPPARPRVGSGVVPAQSTAPRYACRV